MITAVPGLRVGHWTDPVALTGCTVILPPSGTIGSVAIPGNAPATRETDVIAPGRRVHEVNAIVLTGGSAFGLGVADGVMRWLEERGVGHATPWQKVPIVPTAAIFDLNIGDRLVRPNADAGYAACDDARDDDAREGNVGAGTGATVGKTAGPDFMSKGGLGSASARVNGVTVGALAVVNAVGDVIDADGSVIAGARSGDHWMPPTGTATTIACVATDATLDKDGCFALANAAVAGLLSSIRPVLTMFDGDTVFALATGSAPPPQDPLGPTAALVLAEAIRRAARAAESVPGAPARGQRP